MSPALDDAMRIRPILVFSLLVAFGTPALARGTLDSILPQIRAQHPGRLSDAEPWTDADGNAHYRIKWMTPEGRILYFDADARTGRYSSAGGSEGADWRDRRFDQGTDGGRDRSNRDQDGGDRRNHWNGDEGGGDWRGAWHTDRGGDWRGHGGDRGGNWGGWRGGNNGGDNGGRHHHGY
jgi:hypothetical protein